MLSYSQKCFSYKFFLIKIVQQLLPFQEIVQLRHVHYISLAKGFLFFFMVILPAELLNYSLIVTYSYRETSKSL